MFKKAIIIGALISLFGGGWLYYQSTKTEVSNSPEGTNLTSPAQLPGAAGEAVEQSETHRDEVQSIGNEVLSE